MRLFDQGWCELKLFLRKQFATAILKSGCFGAVVLSALIFFTFVGCQNLDGALINGMKAPNITLPDTLGNSLSLDSIRQNKIVIVDFWASWCKPCLKTHEQLKEIYAEWKDKPIGEAKSGLTIYSVSLDSKPDEWKNALHKYQITWPYQVNDPKALSSAVAQQYIVNQVPTIYVLDQNGIVIGKNITRKWLDYELKRRN